MFHLTTKLKTKPLVQRIYTQMELCSRSDVISLCTGGADEVPKVNPTCKALSCSVRSNLCQNIWRKLYAIAEKGEFYCSLIFVDIEYNKNKTCDHGRFKFLDKFFLRQLTLPAYHRHGETCDSPTKHTERLFNPNKALLICVEHVVVDVSAKSTTLTKPFPSIIYPRYGIEIICFMIIMEERN